jgi:phage virion morphogenesis protein
MTGDLTDVQTWAMGLMARLAPGEQRKVNRAVAMVLRASQSARIAAQKSPDGAAYPARRPGKNLRGKKGRIRGKMFQKLRTARYLRATATAEEAIVGFSGQVARIARVHQEGLMDKPTPKSRAVRYAVRTLLGFSEEDRKRILEAYANQLAGRGL